MSEPTLPGAGMFTGEFRDRVCLNCGREYRQYRLSARFWEWVQNVGNERQQALMKQAIPEEGLPVNCVPCERAFLGERFPSPQKPPGVHGRHYR
jgi:hypothetical protein